MDREVSIMDEKNKKEFFKRVDEVLFYQWDHIGVSDTPEARGEYDSYVHRIAVLVMNDTEESVAKELVHISKDLIGLEPNESHDRKIVRLLFGHKYAVEEGLR